MTPSAASRDLGFVPARAAVEGDALKAIKIGRRKSFTRDEALVIATQLGMDFKTLKYNVEQFRMGLGVELEHGPVSPATNVTGDDALLTGKIALAHLNEFPDYYTRLEVLEHDAALHRRARP
jgi:hypothetical protein